VIPRGKEAAALALHRFGFGPSVTALNFSIAAVASDPRGAILTELDRPRAGMVSTNLLSSAQAVRAVSDYRAEKQAKKKVARRAQNDPQPEAGNSDPATVMTAISAKPPESKELPLPQRIIQDEAVARYDAASEADIGFVQRLVWFWSNHFCVSADKDSAAVGAYEREAIRPHVLGRFGDMLQAVESHPAMLFYLDNVQSMGADSIAGINRDKGLNENLAREILELHTLGVRSGYSQADVTSFANVLTGWTWIEPGEPEHGGEFLFNKRLHQPGRQTVLGKLYPEAGVEQGRAVLANLARHPATAQHVAQKLACYFVADDPPPSLVARLAKTFRETDGDLKDVAKTLVSTDEAWRQERGKLKPPSEWIVGVLRLSGIRPEARQMADAKLAPPSIDVGRLLNFQAVLGEALWRPTAPNGYSDTEAAWIDGVPRRLDVANEFSGRLPPEIDPLDSLDRGLGPLAASHTRETVARAGSRAQAFALLVMAPEYLRR
jgi:uncharacterized protein (DUF1800 family)